MAVLRTHRIRAWKGALGFALACLPTAAGAAPADPAAPAPAAELQRLSRARVALPDTPAFRKALDLEADQWTIPQIVAHLREKCELPVEIPPDIKVGETRLTLRLRETSVETLLTLILEALGEGYRWRQEGEGVILEHPAVGWLASLPEDLAEEIAGPAARPADAPDPFGALAALPRLAALRALLARESAALGDVDADKMACASLMATAFGPRAAEGIPVNALPAPLQQQVFLLAMRGERGWRLGQAVGAVEGLVTNPLVTGVPPRLVYLERSHGNWVLFYGADTRSSRGFGLPPP